MGYEYYYNSIDPGMEALGGAALGVASFFMVFVALFYLAIFVYAIVCYVLYALGLSSIAKRRGIRHPWLSWLPLGDLWIMGSISDQYQYIAKGKVCNRRKILLGLAIAGFCMLMLICACVVVGIVGIATNEMGGAVTGGIATGILVLGYIALIVMAVISVVFQYIALYDIFVSCNPDNAVLFLVLSILFNIAPFFIFFNREKDLGMPARKELEQVPVAQPKLEPVVE